MKQGMKKTNIVRAFFSIFVRAVFRYPFAMVGVVGAIGVAQASQLLIPLYLQKMIDGLASAAPGSISFRSAMVLYVFPVVLIRFVGWASWRISGYIAADLTPKIERDLSVLAFRTLLNQSYRFFTDHFAGSLVRRVKSLGSAFDRTADRILWDVLPMTVTLSGSLYLLMSRSVVLGFILFAWIALLTITNIIVSKIKLPHDQRRADTDTAATGVLADALANISNIFLFTSRRPEEVRFETHVTASFHAQRTSWRISEVSHFFQNTANILCELIIMSFVLMEWIAGRMTVGDLVFVQGVLLVLFHVVHDFGRVIRTIYESSADASEMIEILNQTPEILDAKNAKPLVVSRGAIELENVRFHYAGERRIFDNFSLAVKSKEKVALVGPSGSGKSTVTKLLFRFFDIQKGAIRIDGQNIAKVQQESLRAAIAFVPQEPVLFHRSLMENIRYGRPEASDEEVYEAAKKAHCHEFISTLREGYETHVGERGIKLSGGERQRVAIARAILKDAPILVLDEATSSLDSESEALIQDALKVLMKNKTVIVIAHRLSTIMEMDRIVVMQHGKIIEEGTHERLRKSMGMYQTLWNIQAGGFAKK